MKVFDGRREGTESRLDDDGLFFVATGHDESVLFLGMARLRDGDVTRLSMDYGTLATRSVET